LPLIWVFEMADMRPNLFIIGAMKSRTTSLHNYLHKHPEIFMSSLKEPGYFSNVENTSQSYAAYLSLFVGSENTRYRGESTTHYTKLPFFPNAAPRIYEFNPKARLIYLMREPFDRAVSEYRHQVKMGRESRKLLSALEPESEYLSNSYYAMQLRPYFELFDKDSVFLSTFELFIENPELICSQIFKWLEVDSSFVPPNLGIHYYRSPNPIVAPRDDSFMYRFRAASQKSNLIRSLIPSAIKRLYHRMTPKYVALDSQSELFKREVEQMRGLLRTQFIDWNAELAEMTGLSFHEWKVIHKDVQTDSVTE
jgi:hypothetical protein